MYVGGTFYSIYMYIHAYFWNIPEKDSSPKFRGDKVTNDQVPMFTNTETTKMITQH